MAPGETAAPREGPAPGPEVTRLIERLRSTVQAARSMPLSSSVVLNKAEVLGQLDALESALPSVIAASEHVFSERETLVAEARERAARILDEAARERDRLVRDSEVVALGRAQIEQARTAVERECEALRRETDHYVDGRLADLEISLTKTLEAVSRGRDRLNGRSDLDRLDAYQDGDGVAFPE